MLTLVGLRSMGELGLNWVRASSFVRTSMEVLLASSPSFLLLWNSSSFRVCVHVCVCLSMCEFMREESGCSKCLGVGAIYRRG